MFKPSGLSEDVYRFVSIKLHVSVDHITLSVNVFIVNKIDSKHYITITF